MNKGRDSEPQGHGTKKRPRTTDRWRKMANVKWQMAEVGSRKNGVNHGGAEPQTILIFTKGNENNKGSRLNVHLFVWLDYLD